MGMKKTCRKNVMVNNEKENLNEANGIESEGAQVLKEIGNISEATMDLSINSTSEKEYENEIIINIESSAKEKQVTKDAFADILPLDDVVDGNGEIETSLFQYIYTTGRDSSSLQIPRGQKRPLEQFDSSDEIEKGFSQANDPTVDEVTNLKKKCSDLTARVKHFEDQWMPRPQHPNAVQYIIEIADILRGVPNDSDAIDDENMLDAMELLGIDKKNISKLKKKTVTATARSLIQFKYPNPQSHFGLGDVDTIILDAIIVLTKHLHPRDTSSNKQLRKAMGNYFASSTYRQKVKQLIGLKKPVVEENNTSDAID